MAPRLRLDPEELQVESFDPDGQFGGKGTVLGHESYPLSQSTCFQIMCTCTYGGPGNGTCDYSCQGDPCEPTNVNCHGCGGSGGCGGGGDTLRNCCTGFQVECSGPS